MWGAPIRRIGLAAVLAVAAAACGRSEAADGEAELVVFAAASLQDAVAEVARAFEAAGTSPRRKVVVSYAGSNVLARQIEAAPVADVFVSANERWVDHLADRGALVEGSRRVILGNRLVVVGREDTELVVRGPADLSAASAVALGDPRGVPAGAYAREWLGDAWASIAPNVAAAPDVRAALALVQADPTVVGVVYRSDVRAARDVRVLLEVAATEGPEIRYVAAEIRRGSGGRAGPGSGTLATAFLEFLSGPEARAIFERHGFVVP